MDTRLSINGDVEMKLTDALMIYRTKGRAAYVTHHPVESGQLGAAKPLNYGFLTELSKQLDRHLPVEVLPENVLARTNDVTVWWTPERKRVMFFTDDSKDGMKANSGQIYPQPALVWMVRRDQLYVRALLNSQRPTAGTHMYIAPYWNVSPEGSVCVGNMLVPNDRSISALNVWEEGFYRSQFSHPNTPKIIDWNKGYANFLHGIADFNRFPTCYLLLAKGQILADFIKERD